MLYQRGLKDRGAVVQTGARVSGLCRHKAAWVIALGERGSGDSSSIEADIVVNAAGAWAGSIGKLAGASPVTLTPMRRSAAIIPAPENADAWPLVHTINEELYFKPESPGLMICPQDETPSEPMDAFPDEIDIAIAADRFTHIVDHSFSQVLHRWAGLRTFAPDRRPVVGFDQNAQGFFWLAGQGGFGVQTSPGLGQLTAQAIHTGTSIETRINVTRFAR
jgi:D-arginine dehydrogenase